MRLNNCGIILLELLVTILLIEVGIIGLSQLFLNSSRDCYELQQSLQALEYLRGEMENLQKVEFMSLASHLQDLTENIVFSLQVDDYDPDCDGRIDYKILIGQVNWLDIKSRVRCYRLVTYRHGE